jgi:hypothetical protein
MSIGTSTIRGIILVAAVVIGILMIGQAFGSSSTPALHASSPKPSPSPSASPSPSPSQSTAPPLNRQTAVNGVTVQVLNGSGVDGLAASVADSLKNKGYTICDSCVETAAVEQQTTTIYYAQGKKDIAQYMKEHNFPDAAVKPAKNLFTKPVDLTVLVGKDQAP